MSKLAAVRTGQPTQGVNAAPQANHSPAQERAAAAQVAVMEDAAHALDAQLEAAAAPASIRPRYARDAAQATVTAAWLSLEAKELEVRQYFRKVPVPSGLELLAKMRKQCDLAAETLQQRMDEGNTERCTGCNKTLEEVHKSQWLMIGSDVDPATGVPVPYRFCGPLCVRERNREKMLPKEFRNQKRFDGEDIAEVR
jgi:hypothetical protein